MRWLSKVYLWLMDVFDIEWTPRTVAVATGAVVGIFLLGLGFVVFRNVSESRQQAEARQAEITRAREAREVVNSVSENTFANERKEVTDSVWENIQENFDEASASHYMNYLVSAHDYDSKKRAYESIPWSSPSSAGSDLQNPSRREPVYARRIAVLENASKNYGFETEVWTGIYNVTLVAKDGTEVQTTAVATLAVRSGKVVAWSVTEGNVS